MEFKRQKIDSWTKGPTGFAICSSCRHGTHLIEASPLNNNTTKMPCSQPCGKPCCQKKCKTPASPDDVNLGITFDKSSNRYNVKLNGCEAGSCASKSSGGQPQACNCGPCVTLCPPTCPQPQCLAQCPPKCQGKCPPPTCCMAKCSLPTCPLRPNPCDACSSKPRYNRW
ncbi:hypothetical protein TSMEX_003649 [Taenia solium]|eukprot:TsM_000365900 transcript=TsM_000365900 gene=TsM_000365900